MPTPPTPPLPLPIRTERLVLRAARADDVDSLHDYLCREDVCLHLPHPVQSREQCATRVQAWSGCVDPRADGDHLLLFVELDGRHVGHVILFLRGPGLAKGEVGWALHPDVRGRGLATEAARALLELGFRHYAMHRISARLDSRNEASARVCDRLGMRREALLRQDWFKDGRWSEHAVHAILRDEWQAPTPGG